MKEKVKKGWLVACACTCAGLLFAGSALLLPRSENALAAEVPDAKVYYYVDCGNYVDNEEGTGNFVYRDANGNDKTGHPSTQTTGWMTAHNLEFGTSTNHGAGENVLYNSVTDKAFGLDGTEADTEKTNGTGKKWGFISNDSEMNRWSYGWTHKDIPTPENKDQTGFNTARFQKPANAGGEHFQYKFQVDNNTDDLAVIVGTKKVEDWGGSLKTKIYVNGADSGDIASEPGDELTYFYTAKGVEEAGEYYITLKFGEKPNDEVHVAWILIATGNHETIKTYPGKPATTYAGYAQEGVDKVYVKPYALPVEEITLDQSNKDKINAAESFADVTLNFATSGDNAKDFTYAVIPKETVYFINASPADDGIMATYSDVYSSEKGYGRKEGNSNGETFWADEPFDQSTLGGNLSETFEYQFDLEKGTYAFAIGTYGRWNQTRIMNVTIDGALKGELTSRPETAEHGTFYHTVEQADGKKTIDVSITNKEGQDQGYQFAYILVYKVNKVTFDPNEGTGVSNDPVYYEDSATGDLPTPTKTHYDFDGWYKTESGTDFSDKVDDLSGVTDDVELHAKWTPHQYTITFTGEGVNENAVKYTVEDENVTLPSGLTRKGYTFGGWQKGDEDFIYKKGETTGDITLTAKWTAKTYNFTWNAGTEGTIGTAGSSSVAFNEAVTLPTVTPNAGKTLKGWFTQATGGDEVTAQNVWEKVGDETNVTFYAQYETATYDVTFDLAGGTGTVATQNVQHGSTATEPSTNPTKEGYTFKFWAKKGTETEFQFTTEITEDTELVAVWEVNKYTVHFNSHEGSAVADKTNVEYNTTITAPADPTREGYTFGGWYKDEACTQKFDFENDKITSETTLHAKWTAVPAENPGNSGSTDNGTTDNSTDKTDDKSEEKGCGSAIAAPVAMIASAVLMVGVALVIRKKHSEN